MGKTSHRKGARYVIILVCRQRPERSPVRPSGMKGHPGLSAGETCLKRRVVSEKVLAGTEIQRSWGKGGGRNREISDLTLHFISSEGGKAQDSDHKPQLGKRKEIRSGLEPAFVCLPA